MADIFQHISRCMGWSNIQDMQYLIARGVGPSNPICYIHILQRSSSIVEWAMEESLILAYNIQCCYEPPRYYDYTDNVTYKIITTGLEGEEVCEHIREHNNAAIHILLSYGVTFNPDPRIDYNICCKNGKNLSSTEFALLLYGFGTYSRTMLG